MRNENGLMIALSVLLEMKMNFFFGKTSGFGILHCRIPILESMHIQFEGIAKFLTWGNGRDRYESGAWAKERVGWSEERQC